MKAESALSLIYSCTVNGLIPLHVYTYFNHFSNPFLGPSATGRFLFDDCPISPYRILEITVLEIFKTVSSSVIGCGTKKTQSETKLMGKLTFSYFDNIYENIFQINY